MVKKDARDHPYLEFASRYGNPTYPYLSAYIAIARLDMLFDELRSLSSTLNNRSEFISYFSVGFVTCLEWHARSRLVDILTFKPSTLMNEDVSRTGDKLLAQLVTRQATVMDLVGAATKVTSLDSYLMIMRRVFEGLSFECSVDNWLAGTFAGSDVCWLHPGSIPRLKELFDFRHRLVHEIGIDVMGHHNLRDNWDVATAVDIGNITASLMYGIEAAITKFAPSLFPNVLDADRCPKPSLDLLKTEIARLNAQIDAIAQENQFYCGDSLIHWQEARDAFSSYLVIEEDFIQSAYMIHQRYVDYRTPLVKKILSDRIRFLNDLLSSLM